MVVAQTLAVAKQQYDRVRQLLGELGLPEAADKSQAPSQTITWLGITISSIDMSLSIPEAKITAALEAGRACRGQR